MKKIREAVLSRHISNELDEDDEVFKLKLEDGFKNFIISTAKADSDETRESDYGERYLLKNGVVRTMDYSSEREVLRILVLKELLDTGETIIRLNTRPADFQNDCLNVIEKLSRIKYNYVMRIEEDENENNS